MMQERPDATVRERRDPSLAATERPRRDRGVVVIIAYKFIKGGLWLVSAALLVAFMRSGVRDRMLDVAEHLRHHSGAWSFEIARLVTRAATPRGLWTIAVALTVDGTFNVIEGWALVHGKWWGPWLVVVSTGSFLPIELIAFARHPQVARAAVFLVNAAIVAYLARKALRERSMGATRKS
jgi:uncharacterized membrane protein (DUF2068 family)